VNKLKSLALDDKKFLKDILLKISWEVGNGADIFQH
jgi:hypothetical protein